MFINNIFIGFHIFTRIQADPHDAKTLLRTKIRFAMPPSSLNSKKLLSVSPKDADVGLEGRGDSLYLGKYRKIKIPFQITDAKFNWKTRKIEFFLQNDGLSNTRRLRFKGILGDCLLYTSDAADEP